jgi:hypothetical protein
VRVIVVTDKISLDLSHHIFRICRKCCTAPRYIFRFHEFVEFNGYSCFDEIFMQLWRLFRCLEAEASRNENLWRSLPRLQARISEQRMHRQPGVPQIDFLHLVL